MDEFPDIPEFTELVREAITDCNGFVYNGSDLEAQIRLIKWLRINPEKAERMLKVN